MKSKYPVLAGSILICELVVVYFAALTAYGLTVKTNGTLTLTQLLVGASIIAVVAIVAVVLLPRQIGQRRPGAAIGWLVQVLLVATGFVIPAMFFVAAIFVAMYAVAVYWSARIDCEVAERA
ncbi:DUF4233 domain-containing protein [Brevibacterium casei]|uniref:DUF4233 domain-containing protein n=1 Tax=Brevibacterium casei TaxID=33889 RepID=A0A269ZDZ6_9MICO|nr:DUF4233 domain-containing protein [Brevibacterium casei]MBE4693610.1 DUF4233 domain-containing protein [Brevibacterium casei]MBY3576733.1 DUF4233 domain-containing protein [Brevibacterium casei]MCT1767458.1 DUF4233 domain-containing protein [Brevibacterium casei]MCT2184009.1 DUF4233 domain-containing protein [Brevibacterium casei]MCT2359801.1 DUF4233 domain-containing protein [Brevibacterium casei]